MQNTILGAEMKESKWTRLKDRALLIWGGVVAVIAISILNSFEEWWKYLFIIYYSWMGWLGFKTGLFGSNEEVWKLIGDKPVSEGAKSWNKEQHENNNEIKGLSQQINECKAENKEKIEINKQEKPILAAPLQANAAAPQRILKIRMPLHAEGDSSYKIGDRIANRYEVFRIFGGRNKSGMGIVYECYDHEFKDVCALKTFQDKYLFSKEMRNNFKKEAFAWIQLEKHPNIVHAKYVKEIDNRLFIVCEFIAPDEQGRNMLAHYLKIPIPFKQALTWSIQFCYGMEHAYSKGVTPHRDIKPDNIMITNDKTLKITDFGIAGLWKGVKISEDLMLLKQKGLTFLRTADNRIIAGTPPYMAPEQFNGEADVRSDIYVFGIVMYQMLHRGELPFYPKKGDSWETAHKSCQVLQGQAKGRTGSRLFTIIDKCLRKNPDERYSGFKALRDALEVFYIEATGEMPPFQPDEIQLESWELVNKGVSLMRLGLLDEATKAFYYAIRINPESAEAHYNLGIALIVEASYNLYDEYYYLTLIDEAIKFFDDAIRINPEYAEAYNSLVDPKSTEGYYSLNFSLYDKNQINKLIKAFREIGGINQKDAEANNNLGIALADNGQLDDAIKAYQCAVRINPAYAIAYYNIGNALKEKGCLDEAINAFKKFMIFASTEHVEYVKKAGEFINLHKEEM